MATVLGIEFAPLKIPLKRRLQTLAIFLWCFDFLFFGLLSTVLMISLLFTPLYPIPIVYFAWMIYDRNACNTGGHLQMWYRKLTIWRYCAEYFPMKLHKTVDLDATKNYIFGCHPHGITALGSYLNFSTEATGFSDMFPGITSRMATLNINFWMPLHREHFNLQGLCSANRESIEWIISENGKGNAAIIVIGGSAESFAAIPHKMDLTLKHRKGFVKLALKHGVSLVPVISFGDNELYSQKERSETSRVRRIQRKLANFLTFAPIIFNGRGIFQYSFGILPFRKHINTIVGKPIEVPQVTEPSKDLVNEYHSLYVEALRELFYAHRSLFSEDPLMEICIV